MNDPVATSDPPRKPSVLARAVTIALTATAILSLFLFLASAAALIPNHRTDTVLLKRSPDPGHATFLAAGNDALRVTRQRMVPTTQGVTVDATQLDTYSVTASSAGKVIEARSGNQQIAVMGSIKINFASKPATRGGLGVRWGEYGITPNLTTKVPVAGAVSPGTVQIQSLQFRMNTQNLFVSYWAMLIASAVVACVAGIPMYRRIRRGRRVARNLCATCGYDLRASPDRCPECGTPITRDRTVSAATSHDRSTGSADDAAKTSAGTASTSSAPIA